MPADDGPVHVGGSRTETRVELIMPIWARRSSIDRLLIAKQGAYIMPKTA